jgi:hypothetical protein
MMDKDSGKLSISLGEQEKGGNWFAFRAGVTDAYSAVSRFFDHIMSYKSHRSFWNTESQE